MTPQNDVFDLPTGATPVDFAYHIHSEIGHSCVGAKVNGNIVPLNYELQSGDLVEILIQKGKKPSPDWLSFIKTTLAAAYIKNALRAKNKNLLNKIAQTGLELRIITKDRPGYLKDVATAFTELKINIVSVVSQNDSKSAFVTVVIKCGNLEKTKLEKLLFKLKKIPNTREVNYKFTR
ncbi:MAG: TGS domain-containing protein [Patescibacteria group bacterium]